MKHFLATSLKVMITLVVMSHTLAQGQSPTGNFYVVIGAFANPRNAAEFLDGAKKKNQQAKSILIPSRKLNYIYVLETPDKAEAVTLAVKLQREPTYSDTWVYSELTDSKVKIEEEKVDTLVQVPVKEEVKLPAEPVKSTDGSKPFIFKLKSVDTGQEVVGDVDIFDADVIKGRKIISYRGNDVVNVKPINKSGNLAVVCDIFGYRKVQLPINFNEPKFEDAVTQEGGNIVVNLDLIRLQKGDKVVMYNVYFFNHAAIMRPESRFEVNALLEMLKEKSTSKIKIHGHANGNDRGKIITLGKSTDFFALSTDNAEGKGSATELSEERARVIQSYLVSNGIDIGRMELKAWGGKMPIYDEDHSLAHANVRVEIEILEE